MAKSKETAEIMEKIFDYTLEDIMGERFGSYSKYIIQERAIPDARDGLKPVQRRILYSMYHERNTYDKPYKKSASTVGDVIGKYHPHGDTSIYDAMVHMSQSWKARLPYIDMHGNNGSIDGDSPAAYRYTEARLSKVSNEMVRDIDKDTVEFAPNFDDSRTEPTVMPARFPALLVNGSTGISAGYATNIPPHNLGEAIDAAIYRIDHPCCELSELMNFVKGPDFPTGAIIEGKNGLIDAYTTGRGKIVVRSKVEFEEERGKVTLIVTEIPYDVNKAMLVKKIDDIRIDKKVEGIVEVRDESAEDIRIAIELKKGANQDLVLNYLYKNTDMQSNYNFNMIAIVNKCPKQLGLSQMIDAFLAHRREVVERRTKFDLAMAQKQLHIVEGLIKCLSILDEVIRVIRASKNKVNAKENLVKEFQFTMEQAEAIVTLQLYRLTNTDVVELEEELKNLNKIVLGLTKILASESALKKVIKQELEKIKEEYPTPRLTEIRDEIQEIKIDTIEMLPKEDVIVVLTKDGYIKRTSLRSYQASDVSDITLKENDFIIGYYEMNTLDILLVFTSFGHYLHIPVHMIPDLKWKDMGKHISNLILVEEGEEIISSIPVYDFKEPKHIILASKGGMIKRCELEGFRLSRYSKPTSCMKLKDGDQLIDAIIESKENIFLSTKNGYGLAFKAEEVPIIGVKAAGVKGITLKEDEVVSVNNFSYDVDEYLTVITTSATMKRIKLNELDLSTRTRKGLLLFREVKKKPYKLLRTFVVSNKSYIGLKTDHISQIKVTDAPILDRYSTGKEFLKKDVVQAFVFQELYSREEVIHIKIIEDVPKVEQIDLSDIDNRLQEIDEIIK